MLELGIFQILICVIMTFMRDFSRDRRSSGGRDFKRRDFDKPQMMHKTICSNCGKECEVPFKPNGSKPVFCRECFQSNRTGEPVRRENDYAPRSQTPPPPPPPAHKEEFAAINAKLDKIMNLLITAKEVSKASVAVAVEPKTVVEEKVETPVEKVKLSETKSRAKPSGKVAKKSPVKKS